MQYRTYNLSSENPDATMKAYILDEEITHKRHINRPLMVVCPGGGYLSLAHKESEPVVARFLGLGFNVVLVNYSVYFKQRPDEQQPAVINEDYHIKNSLADLVNSLNIIDEHASKWFIDKQRIYLLGFSAGSHLVTMFAENYQTTDWRVKMGLDISFNIRGLLLSYPMLSADKVNVKAAKYFADMLARENLAELDLLKNVSAKIPRTFIWQGNEDLAVSPLETSRFALKLQEAGVSCEYHLFSKGGHGLALADRTSAVLATDVQDNLAIWVSLAKTWLAQDESEIQLFADERQ